MDDGAYARVFLFSLENDMQVVARVILPVRESLKTEAEVVTMEVVRGKMADIGLDLGACYLFILHSSH